MRANYTRRPFDTSLSFTVHSLLVVDAIQTFGSDFELLVASHKNLWYVGNTFQLGIMLMDVKRDLQYVVHKTK